MSKLNLNVEQLKTDLVDWMEGFWFLGECEDEDEIEVIEVRVQIFPDGSYEFHSGDPQYDTNHQGYWGYSDISPNTDNLTDVAEDMIEEALDEYEFDLSQR